MCVIGAGVTLDVGGLIQVLLLGFRKSSGRKKKCTDQESEPDQGIHAKPFFTDAFYPGQDCLSVIRQSGEDATIPDGRLPVG
jgi:hypothetical protein